MFDLINKAAGACLCRSQCTADAQPTRAPIALRARCLACMARAWCVLFLVLHPCGIFVVAMAMGHFKFLLSWICGLGVSLAGGYGPRMACQISHIMPRPWMLAWRVCPIANAPSTIQFSFWVLCSRPRGLCIYNIYIHIWVFDEKGFHTKHFHEKGCHTNLFHERDAKPGCSVG